MGLEAGEKGSSKVLIYPPGETDFVRYEGTSPLLLHTFQRLTSYDVASGISKHDSLTKFFDSIIDGTANLEIANKEASQEEFTPSEEDLEIERQQEAQRIALAHGGYK